MKLFASVIVVLILSSSMVLAADTQEIYVRGCSAMLNDETILSFRELIGLNGGNRVSYCDEMGRALSTRFGPIEEALADIKKEGKIKAAYTYANMCMTLGRVYSMMDSKDMRKFLYMLGEVGRDRSSQLDNSMDMAIFLAFNRAQRSGSNISLDALLGWSLEENKYEQKPVYYKKFLIGLLKMDEAVALKAVRSVPDDKVHAIIGFCGFKLRNPDIKVQ